MLRPVDIHKSYLKHLNDFAKEHGVTICEDICNEHGAVIITKGRQFDADLSEKISNHTLKVPLEQCIKLNRRFDGAALLHVYQHAFQSHPDINLFHQRWDLQKPLKRACRFYHEFPLVVQKITILKAVMPRLFKQAIYSAYISLAIAKQLGAPEEECSAAFLAGLVHDIGILHLESSLVTTKGEYTPEQWHAMQRHTLIGHDILKSIEHMPSVIAKAVLEHHERVDGSGYPFSKKGLELSVMGQIVGMADTCIALYRRELASKSLGIDSLLPILQLNPDMYCRKVFHATVTLINEIQWPSKRVYSDDKMPELMSRLKLENEWIHHDYSVLYGLVTSVRPHLEESKRSAMLTNMAQRIHRCLVGSGILQKEHNDWMLHSFITNNHEDYIAIERLEVMYGEIKWQMKQLKKLLFLLWKNQHLKHPELDLLVRKGLMQIEQYHKHHTEPELH